MKKILISIICCYCSIAVWGQEDGVDGVRQFGNNLNSWCLTRDGDYRRKAQEQCTEACRVENSIMDDFASNSGLDIKNHVVQYYLIGFQKRMNEGHLLIELKNIRIVSQAERSYDVFVSSQTRKKYKDITTIACDFIVSGVINYNIKDLYYVKDGKIIAIKRYEEVVDSAGKTQVKVDFSDIFINDYETVGFSYNCGKCFPIGGSFNYSLEDIPFMVSVDFGINLDGDKYIVDKVKMKDIMNYDRTKKTLDSKFFLTVTPHFYLKYFAIGCGAGFLWMNGTEDTANYAYTPSCSPGSNVSGSVSSASGQTSEGIMSIMLKPMIRPVAKGFIPLHSDELYLSISVGYDLIFGYKDKNGFNFGLGLQWEL